MAVIERKKNAKRNILFGTILRVYQIIVPFLMRTAMIYWMGIQYLGLNSLFSSILQVLNLAELGVGSAMVYSMYKPIAEDDEITICALMNLYKKYYRIIGLVIAAVGSLLAPFVPKLISGEVPAGLNVYVLYLLNLAATVLSYWLFAYKNSILSAHQRVDIVNKITIILSTFEYCLQAIVLWIFRNYYYFVLVTLFSQVAKNIITAIVSDKLYPRYNPKGELPAEEKTRINKRITDLFTSKLGAVIYNSADTVVISAFLGLTVLAIYQNYFFILTAITGFVSVIFTSCTAGIGNSIIVETKEKNYNDFKKFTFIICWIAGFCSVCLLCLYQPFIEIWVGKDLMLPILAVIFFVAYFFMRQLNSLLNLYKDASGMWHEDRFRPLVASLTNLVLNLILVNFIGIYGILLSTVLAILCVGMPWLVHNLFTVIFEKKHQRTYLLRVLKYCFVVAIACFITYLACFLIETSPIMNLIIRFLICLVVPNVLFFAAFRKTEEFKESLCLANSLTNGKLTKVFLALGMDK